jgi:hypothetical protein
MPRKLPPAAEPRHKAAVESEKGGPLGIPLPTTTLLFFALALTFALLYYGITSAQFLQKHWPSLTSLLTPPEQFLQQRWQTLAFLFAPDELFLIWCGGKLSYFSLFDRWPIALLATIILTAAWLAGRLVLLAIGVMGLLTRLERIVFSLGVGLNLLSLYALAVGLAGGSHQRWLFIVPIILLLAGRKLAPGMRREVGRPPLDLFEIVSE